MQTRASKRRAAMASSSPPNSSAQGQCLPSGWLLALPGPAHPALVESLKAADRRSLRLVCKDATALVDRHTAKLQLTRAQLEQFGILQRQRFPAVEQLKLLGPHQLGTDGSALAEQLGGAAPWTTITSLTLPECSVPAVANKLATVTSVKHLCLLDVWNRQKQLPLLEPLSQQLQQMVSLRLGASHRLGDQQLQALAALPALTGLDASISIASLAGCSALTGMQTLQSLCVHRHRAHQPVHQLQHALSLDLRHMTALTQLHWRDHNKMETVLQLPTSLRCLALNGVPGGPASPLPHLTSLALSKQAVGQQQLAWLAAKCSALAQMELCQLDLTKACHSMPLQALTQLVVTDHATEAAGAQYAKAFPQLRELSLRHPARDRLRDMEPRRFGGLTALTRLDVGRGLVIDKAVNLRRADFEALAELPSLHTLRLNVEPAHVEGLVALTQLRHLEIAWETAMSRLGDLESACPSFASSAPPVHLCSASLQFFGGIGQPMVNHTRTTICKASVTAALAWLARAIALREVSWKNTGLNLFSHTICTFRTLATLSDILSIVRIEVSSPRTIINALQPRLPQLCCRGIDIILSPYD